MGKRKSDEEVMAASPSPSPEPIAKKRKQSTVPEDEELEIDVSLPEPPSKKAKRAERKSKKSSKPSSRPVDPDTAPSAHSTAAQAIADQYAKPHPDTIPTLPTPATRSEYGIWIGNLPFSATKDSLRQFLREEGGIVGEDLVRLHMPAPTDKAIRGTNKGFAYVDFTTEAVLGKAMALTEFMMSGRRVLIKNAKSFEGRPAVTAADKKQEDKVEPTKRVFVGNLSFDVMREDLEEHFAPAGETEDVFLATFQDTGKCKGFAWVRFVEAEAAEAAVRGFVYVKAEEDEGSSGEGSEDEVVDNATGPGSKKRSKKKGGVRRHKKHINQLHGRPLRVEFAEDAQTRYKKRYGGKGPRLSNAERAPAQDRRAPPIHSGRAGPAKAENFESLVADAAAARGFKGPAPREQRRDKEERRDARRIRHEARSAAPAGAPAQRATGAIVQGRGVKTAVDEAIMKGAGLVLVLWV
ncbi:Nucleolar protein 13 [Teratosphaeriaceae sp. CCFEE 6253]|nr:Nucleolar protein 13 [Teratosphaeriaceae sp. CCFEE 6253]